MGDTGTHHLCNLSVNWNFKLYFFNKEEKEYQVAFKISRRIREPDLREWCPSQELVPWRSQCTISEHKHSMSTTYLMAVTLFFNLSHAACGILILQTGTKPMPPALEAKNRNHWTAREAPWHRYECKLTLLPAQQNLRDLRDKVAERTASLWH